MLKQPLSQIHVVLMQNTLGKKGVEFWRRANGIGESPLILYSEQKSITTEETFQSDTTDINFLHARLTHMTEGIAFELRQQKHLPGCITLKLRYSNFETFAAQRTIPYINTDHILQKTVMELFTKLYTHRILVRLAGIRFTNLVTGAYQINLFEDTQESINLYQAIDSVKRRFGERYLTRAGGV